MTRPATVPISRLSLHVETWLIRMNRFRQLLICVKVDSHGHPQPDYPKGEQDGEDGRNPLSAPPFIPFPQPRTPQSAAASRARAGIHRVGCVTPETNQKLMGAWSINHCLHGIRTILLPLSRGHSVRPVVSVSPWSGPFSFYGSRILVSLRTAMSQNLRITGEFGEIQSF